jgi:hypothetical protein
MTMADQYRVIRIPQDLLKLEADLNMYAAEGFDWVAQIQAGHLPAIVMRKSD